MRFLTSITLQIEEAGKFKPLEVDLKKLEDMSDAIVQDFAATRKREEEMRSTNGLYSFDFLEKFANLFETKTKTDFYFSFHFRIDQQSCIILQYI